MIPESGISLVDGRVFGLLAEPAQPRGDLALVLPNAGAIHRAGPFRLHVHLARRALALGLPSLRVDLPGIGESLRSADRPQAELGLAVLDELQARTGVSRFIVGGICSAADLAWWMGINDPRIVGLLLLDPVARRDSAGFRRGRWDLLRARGARAALSSLAARLRPGRTATAGPEDAQLRDWPSPGEEAGQLTALVARDVRVLFVYTGGAARYMTHASQFREGFGAAADDPRIRFAYWRDCDHLFYRPEHRERLLETVSDWLAGFTTTRSTLDAPHAKE